MIHDDAMLGQLALARGLVSFRALIECIKETGTQERTFEDVLIARGHLSYHQLEELKDTLRQNPEQSVQEIEAGQTLVLEHIQSTTNSGLSEDTDAQRALLSMQHTLIHLDEADLIPVHQTSGAVRMTPPPLKRAQQERYELRKMLGKGGMGEVWLAYDRMLLREIALKTLHVDSREHRDRMREQLKLEAQVTGLLEHPSIIPVYDIGELEDRGIFYTMRVVREESLETRLKRLRDGQADADRLPQQITYLRTALLALQYAHDHGVIHRDLKPENILVGAYGEVFVIDWGVAKLSDGLGDGSLSGSLSSSKPGTLVGTPHYMAPEQALGEHEKVDERTDVYAIGVILYEILTLGHVFDAGNVLALLFKITEETPTPPSVRAPDREIPEELEEICLKALSKEPEERYQSAQEMARELELFLEGIKEGERARARAETLLAQAHKQRKAYHGARSEFADAQEKLTKAQMEIQSWASAKEKEPLWTLEQEVEDLRMEIERHFGEAVRTFGQALGHVTDHARAREGLAELYWERFLAAEASGDSANALYFEGLVKQYNDGQYNTLLAGQASLSISPNVAGAVCKLYRYERGMHRLQAILKESLAAPVTDFKIPHGSYLLTIEAPGFTHRRIPLLLERLQEVSLEVSLYPQGSLPDDMIVITGGEFLSGHIKNFERARYIEDVEGFALMRYPVTCAQYAEFLTALARSGREAEAADRAPRLKDDAPSYFAYDEQDKLYFIPEEDDDGDAWDPQWPICLISASDAEAYAAWRSEAEGFSFRLPTALEWEKAARGVDGRLYSWGNEFDAAFCRVRESVPGRAMPAPVGSYPMDCSPYGVMDMTGCICEWTSTSSADDQKARICQGASFATMQAACRLDWPFTCPPNYRHPTYGFRLAMDLP
jgi:serine/threonine-protein kinase